VRLVFAEEHSDRVALSGNEQSGQKSEQGYLRLHGCRSSRVVDGLRGRVLPTSEMLTRFLASVFFANHRECAEFHNATEQACSYLRTTWMIAEVFAENLFVAVRRFNARFYGDKRNGRSLQASCLVFVNLFCE
jgi:hypothetical protein